MKRLIPLLILCKSAAFAAEDSQTSAAVVAPVFSPMAPARVAPPAPAPAPPPANPPSK